MKDGRDVLEPWSRPPARQSERGKLLHTLYGYLVGPKGRRRRRDLLAIKRVRIDRASSCCAAEVAFPEMETG